MHHFSTKSIKRLLEDVGFCDVYTTRAGRIGPFAKAMIIRCRKPEDSVKSAISQ